LRLSRKRMRNCSLSANAIIGRQYSFYLDKEFLL
jgi:hypothetical protein